MKKDEMTYEQKLDIRRNPPTIMSILESAIYLGVSERKLNQMIADKEIAVGRLGGRNVMTRKMIDKYVENQITL
jgi:excisionase family DNA binding protein